METVSVQVAVMADKFNPSITTHLWIHEKLQLPEWNDHMCTPYFSFYKADDIELRISSEAAILETDKRELDELLGWAGKLLDSLPETPYTGAGVMVTIRVKDSKKREEWLQHLKKATAKLLGLENGVRDTALSVRFEEKMNAILQVGTFKEENALNIIITVWDERKGYEEVKKLLQEEIPSAIEKAKDVLKGAGL